jgi:alpha-beta hydrolase superfamily lysophospholipase
MGNRIATLGGKILGAMQVDWTSSTLETEDGARLRTYSTLPAGTPKAIVQINHGMAEHADRYARAARVLRNAGYGVFAHDHRGHGHTTAPGSTKGLFAPKHGWDLVIGNVAAVNNHLRDIHEGIPIVCFGHSMGAIIAFNYILRCPQTVAGAALWNSGVETGWMAMVFGTILRIQRMFKGSDVPSGIAQKVTFDAWNRKLAPNRTDFDWLSRDTKEVDKYITDPLCGFPVSIGLWLDLLKGIQFAAEDRNLSKLPKDLPIHLLAGAADPCSEYGRAVNHIAERMNRGEMADVTLAILPDTRHESLNEINREKTLANFIAWLDERFAQPTSG